MITPVAIQSFSPSTTETTESVQLVESVQPVIEKQTSPVVQTQATHDDEEYEYEFGGPIGVILIMVFSHSLILYNWLGFEFYNGTLPIAPVSELIAHVQKSAYPSWYCDSIFHLLIGS